MMSPSNKNTARYDTRERQRRRRQVRTTNNVMTKNPAAKADKKPAASSSSLTDDTQAQYSSNQTCFSRLLSPLLRVLSKTQLALLWVTLCTVLVSRQMELILVFFGFCGCFLLSGIFHKLVMAWGWWNTMPLQGVGVVACSTSFYIWKYNHHHHPHGDDSSLASPPPSSSSSSFEALSVVTGYLAFHLWYQCLVDATTTDATSSIHTSTKNMLLSYANASRVWHDAMTLTAFVVILSHYHEWRVVVEWGDGVLVGGWILYKLLWDLIVCVVPQQYRVDTEKDTAPPPPVPYKQKHLPLGTEIENDRNRDNDSKTVDPSLLWIIRGVSYDLRTFVDRHPGGKEAILLGQGRDCTALFESYHPFTVQHKLILEKYHGRRKSSSPPKQQQQQDVFYNLIKQRVAHVLQTQHHMDPTTDRTAPPQRVAYYCFIGTCLITSFVFHIKGSMLGSFLSAVFGWLIGALGHDAGHFAVSHTPWVNDACVWGMSFLCNPIMWQHQHTFAHHSHTNEFEHDPDLHHFDLLLRVHRRFYQKDHYKLQSNVVFVLFAYSLVVFGTCIWIPLWMIRSGSLYGLAEWTDRKRPWRAIGMWSHWLLYLGLIVLIPFVTSSCWYKALASVMLHMSTSGLLFAIFSQINHLNEASLELKTTSTRRTIAIHSWAADQIETSNNFASRSFLWHVLSNGLNLQIEHHLFPGLNHSHLHLIAPVVRATCDEYGVLYKSYESWRDLMGATLQWLDTLSDAPTFICAGTDEILRNR